jgi:Fuc2NAc and GlcNAc transferase
MAVGLIVAIVAGAVSFGVAWLIYRHATRLGPMQHPNERSSHTLPTPSGGGVGIVAGGTLGGAYAIWSMPGSAFVVAVLALAFGIVGLVDDRRHVPAAVRLIVQLLLVAAMVWTLQPIRLAEAIGLPLPIELGVVVTVLVTIVLAAVYWVNVFNFMDGIDGLAAGQAIFMLGAAIFLAFDTTSAGWSPLIGWMLAVAAATLGFLLLNWPPAKIFMGDAGSTYLGFMIAFAALSTIAAGWLDVFQWLILGALSITDATITLIRRALRREPVMQAHRLHAYQHLARRWQRHLPVTLVYTGINLMWLLPLAWYVGETPGSGLMALAAAYLPIALLLLIAGAGRRET